MLALPIPVLAGLGFVAVFAGAANTPIASTVMAIEMFGADIGVYAALACVVAYLFSGHTGIYRAQRVGDAKHPLLPAGMRLSDVPALRRASRSTSKPGCGISGTRTARACRTCAPSFYPARGAIAEG